MVQAQSKDRQESAVADRGLASVNSPALFPHLHPPHLLQDFCLDLPYAEPFPYSTGQASIQQNLQHQALNGGHSLIPASKALT